MKCPNCKSSNVTREISSGYGGYRCQSCSEWNYDRKMIEVKEYIYVLWIKEDGGNWAIFGYAKNGQDSQSWKEKETTIVSRRVERIYEKEV